MHTESKPDVIAMLDDAMLREPARIAAHSDEMQVTGWDYDAINSGMGATTGGLFRIHGTGDGRGRAMSWSLVLKVVTPPQPAADAGGSGPPAWDEGAADPNAWKREVLAYQTGLLHNLPGGLTVPRCYGVTEQPDSSYWLWLEDVVDTVGPNWNLDRFALAARHLGQFNGAYPAGRPIPGEPWLMHDWLRTWLAARASLGEMLQQPDQWAHPLIRRIYLIPMTERIVRLWNERDIFLDALDRLPQTDGPGSVTSITKTDAFGVPLTPPGTSSSQPFGFAGEQRDSDGLSYVRARSYDPATGRFMSHDPLAGGMSSPQSFNRYSYAMNNPVSNVDPSGLCSDPRPSATGPRYCIERFIPTAYAKFPIKGDVLFRGDNRGVSESSGVVYRVNQSLYERGASQVGLTTVGVTRADTAFRAFSGRGTLYSSVTTVKSNVLGERTLHASSAASIGILPHYTAPPILTDVWIEEGANGNAFVSYAASHPLSLARSVALWGTRWRPTPVFLRCYRSRYECLSPVQLPGIH